MAPICLLIISIHFFLADRIAPYSQQAFIDWWEPLLNRGGIQWLRSDGSLVRISEVSQDGRTLLGLSFFERDESGRLLGRITAAAAEFNGDNWQLHDTKETVLSKTGPEIIQMPTKAWLNGPDPQIILNLIARPEQLSKNTLGQILSVDEPSPHRKDQSRR